tara:strand:- start:189 stop:1082 length:894 start_codon:yes stop_codon:yes gene_type:complete
MAIPEKKPYERLDAYLERTLPGELEAGKSRGKATADIMFKFNEEPKRILDDGIRRIRMGRGSAEVEFDPTDIAHYWYATEAKDAGTTIWTDTGNVGGLDLTYLGGDPTDIVINSASGSYIEVTGGIDATTPAKYNRLKPANFGASNTWSLRMWLRPDQTRSDKVYQLLAYGKQEGGDRYIGLQQKEVGGNPAINIQSVNAGGTGTFTNVNLDQWYMMTITADSTAGELKWYLDNSLIHTTTYTDIGSTFIKLLLFDTPDSTADITWSGDFKLLAGYSKILSLEDIQDSYLYDLNNNF